MNNKWKIGVAIVGGLALIGGAVVAIAKKFKGDNCETEVIEGEYTEMLEESDVGGVTDAE